MSNNLTPEHTNGAGKQFPVQSSMSGYTPEFTVGGKTTFPAAESKLKVGSNLISPEKNASGAFFPNQSQVNT